MEINWPVSTNFKKRSKSTTLIDVDLKKSTSIFGNASRIPQFPPDMPTTSLSILLAALIIFLKSSVKDFGIYFSNLECGSKVAAKSFSISSIICRFLLINLLYLSINADVFLLLFLSLTFVHWKNNNHSLKNQVKSNMPFSYKASFIVICHFFNYACYLT